MPFELITAPNSKSFLSLRSKVEALARIWKGGESAKDVIVEVYGDRPLPKSISMVVISWKRSIMKLLAEDNAEAIALCQEFEIVKTEKVKKAKK